MHTDVTEAGPFERTLTVHIEETELEGAKTAAARKLSSQMKIKGFRPGKAPRAIVERMVGADTLRSEAIDEAIPEIVTKALVETELKPVTSPRLQAVREVDGGVEVDVRITLWPELERAPIVEGRMIEVKGLEVSEDEVQQQLDRLRNQYAELEEVSRPADTGDYAQINLSASRHGVPVEEASASDLLYEVGSGSFVPGLDDMLLGAGPGDIKQGPAVLPDGFGEHAGEEVDLKVLVKGVRAKKLPTVTDEWISDVTEFETVDELTSELRTNLGRMKREAAGAEFQDNLLASLIDEITIELPEALVEAELEASLHNLVHQLEQQGIDLQNFLRITGQTEQQIVESYRERATISLKTRLLLESVVRDEGLAVGEEEFDEILAMLATDAKQTVDEVRERLERTGQGQALTSDILRRKALDHISRQATPVDADGNPVELDLAVEGPGGDEPLAGDTDVADADQDDEPEHRTPVDQDDRDNDGGDAPRETEEEHA